MTQISLISSSRNFYLTFVVACSCFFSLTTFGQNKLVEKELTTNSYKSFSKKIINPAIERPRIVGKDETSKKAFNLLSQMEHLAFDIINQRRIENGLNALKWRDDLAEIARGHSQEMAQYKYFSHSGRDGGMVNDRADILGISNWQAIGENIAFNRGYDKPAEFACEVWMKSPSHRENILNSRWNEAGIGVALAADGSYYFTEVFMMK